MKNERGFRREREGIEWEMVEIGEVRMQANYGVGQVTI